MAFFKRELGPIERFENALKDKLTARQKLSEQLASAERKLADAGIALSQPRKPGKSLDNNRGMWIEDPDGYRIEIMEMAPDCIQYQAERDVLAGGKPHVLSLWP